MRVGNDNAMSKIVSATRCIAQDQSESARQVLRKLAANHRLE
jgi:hypothetical protein